MRPGKRERRALAEIKRQLGEAQCRAALVDDPAPRAKGLAGTAPRGAYGACDALVRKRANIGRPIRHAPLDCGGGFATKTYKRFGQLA